MNLEMFLAVTVVLVLVNLFIALLLVRLSKRVKKQIDANVVSQLSAYDALIDTKSSELSRMKADAQTLSASGAPSGDGGAAARTRGFAGGVSQRRTPDYLDDRLASRYNVIKRSFVFDKAAVVGGVCAELRADPLSRLTAALDERLDLDTVYSMLGADGDGQAQRLKSLLTAEQSAFVDDYISRSKRFDILEFKQYVSAARHRSDEAIYVRTGDETDSFEGVAPNVRTVYDPHICEGLVIVCGNTLYDYSLQKKEINS